MSTIATATAGDKETGSLSLLMWRDWHNMSGLREQFARRGMWFTASNTSWRSNSRSHPFFPMSMAAAKPPVSTCLGKDASPSAESRLSAYINLDGEELDPKLMESVVALSPLSELVLQGPLSEIPGAMRDLCQSGYPSQLTILAEGSLPPIPPMYSERVLSSWDTDTCKEGPSLGSPPQVRMSFASGTKPTCEFVCDVEGSLPPVQYASYDLDNMSVGDWGAIKIADELLGVALATGHAPVQVEHLDKVRVFDIAEYDSLLDGSFSGHSISPESLMKAYKAVLHRHIDTITAKECGGVEVEWVQGFLRRGVDERAGRPTVSAQDIGSSDVGE